MVIVIHNKSKVIRESIFVVVQGVTIFLNWPTYYKVVVELHETFVCGC